MEDISTRIFHKYKKLNILDIAYGKWAKPIKLIIILTMMSSSIYFLATPKENKMLQVIVFGTIFIPFYLYTEKRYINRCEKHENRKAKRKDRNVEKTRLELFYDVLKEEGMDSVEGIEYLIRIFGKRRKGMEIKEIALSAIVISAVINNVMYAFLMANDEDWSRMATYWNIFMDNLPTIVTLVIVLVIVVIIMKKDIEALMVFKGMMFYEGYGRLADILELHFLPMMIMNKKGLVNKNGDGKAWA